MKKDYSYRDLFPGRFIASEDLKGREVTVTIKDVDVEQMPDKKMKCVVTLAETPKQLILNKTNGECVKGMFGVKARSWLGKRLTLFPEPGTYFGKKQAAIRVLGSPDIAKDMDILCKVGRDDPFTVTMKRTGAKPNGKPAPAPAPDATPAAPADVPAGVDDSAAPWNEETGEVLP